MRWSTRVLLSSLAAVLVPLLVLTAVGVPSIADRFSQSTEAALQGSVRAVAALVASGLEDLRREARLLARDPTIVQGVVKSDWATLARAASPRMLSLTLDRVADLIVVVDERGAPLVRVPASADAPSLSLPAGSADAVAAVRVVSGVPMLLAAAPVVNDGRALGTVVVGRRLEAIGRRLGANSFPMELVFLAGGEPAYTTLSAGAAGVRWADAALAGRVEVSGTSYLMRSVGRWPDGTLWLLASDADARATQGLLWTWVAGFVLFAALATFAATSILTRRVLQPIEALGEGARRMAGGDFDARVPVPLGREAELGDVARAFNEMSDSLQRWRGEVGHRNRELEALNAVALTVNRTIDLIPTAEETLEVVRRVAEMDVAALYQAEEGGERLLLIAQRGLSAELAEQVRVRPIEGSQLGKAVRTARPTVAAGALQTELALPIPVKGEVWGVMALVSSSPREFSPEAMQLMEAVAYQVGVAVERASLFAETREKGQRLESLAGLAQTVTSSLDLSQVLDGVVQAAAGLVPDASVRLWIAEEDRLVLRVEGGIAGTALGGRRTVFAVGEGLVGQVAETREPLVVERVVEDPRTVNVEWMRQEGWVSFVGVPLLFQNRLLGVLAILTRRLHRPTKEELELLVSFATQAAISIENARLYNEASRSAAEHQALLEVGGLVGSTLKVERVLDLIVERARALLGVRSAGIFKLDPPAGVLAYERGIGLSPEFIRSLRVPLGEGTSGKAIRYRAPAWTPDILNDTAVVLNDETRALVSREGYRAVLSVPILIKNEPYGVLAVYWWEPHSPTFSEVRLLSALAGQAAVALDNAQLYEAATRREKRLETLGELTRTLTATLSVEEVLKRVVESAVELFGSSVSRLWLVDEDGETLSLRAHAGSVSESLGITRFRVGEGLMGWIVANRAPLVIPDLREDPRVRNRERIRLEGTVSFAGAPLLLGDRALGALSVSVREAHEFSEEEVSLLQSLAHHAAIALENARLFALEQTRRAQVEALVEIERELTAELNPERLLDLIIQRAGALLNARGTIFLLDETNRMLVPTSWYAMPPQIRDFRIPLGVGMAGTAAAERRGLLVNDFSSTAYAASLAEHGIPLLGSQHAMAQPLVSHDRLLGVIAVSREEGGPRFTEGDLETFGSFATQAAIALENARLYREAREHAERLKALDDVNRLVSSSLQVEEVLKNIAQAVSTFFEAPQAHVWVVEPGGHRLRRSVTVGDPEVADGLVDDMAFGEGGVGWVAQQREPILWTDLEQDTRVLRRTWALRHGLRYFTAYPIMLGDRLLGAITMHRPSPYPVTPETQALLGSLVAQAAVALDNARLYAETTRRLEETQTLLAVGQVLSQNLPTQEAMRQVAREVAHAFGADMVGAYFLDAKKEALRAMAGYHVPKQLLQTFLESPFPIAQLRLVQEAWETRKPVWTSDGLNDPRWFPRELLADAPPYSVLFAPTPVRGEIVGGLFLVWWVAGRTFPPAELRLIEGVASQVGLALENADLARQTEEKLRETETLLSVSRTLSSTLDLHPLLRHFLRQVARTIDCDSVGVWMVNPANGRLEPIVGYRVPPQLLDTIRKAQIDPEGSAFYAEGFRSRRVQVSSNVPEDPRIPDSLKISAAHRAQLFAPIVARERVIGAFIAVWWDRTREFSEREVALVEAMGSQAGVAVENARLFEDNRRRLEELSVLHELSRAVTGQLDLAELVRAIHRQVGRILDARNMVILLYDETSREIEVALRMLEGEEHPEPRRYPLGDGLMTRVVERGQPIRTDTYAEECRRQGVRPIEATRRYPHWLGVPLVAGDATIGGLILRSAAQAFTSADERLLVNIAGLAALAIRSARLFDERTRAYRELAAAQDQLIRTEKLRALGEMASGVAHDFNNLLASILGRAQLLMRRVEDPKLRQWLQVIERAAMDGARTVRRIQEFARIRRDQPFVAVDLNRVVQDALEVTQSRWQEDAQSRGVTIHIATDLVPVPPAWGDPAELREVLTNLILNAVDAMPEGGTLTLATRADETTVSLTVNDTGVGMTPDVQPRIFDPFFTTKGPSGTGLGLSITYGIVSRHGGQIRVESAEGQGTTFHLTFPVSTVEAEPPGPAALEPVAPLRCLVVDDEQPVLEVLGDVLAAGGHSAVLVADGAEAIRRFKAEPFDIVFTDLAMPGVNGWQVARAVKDQAPSVPVLLVTGWAVELSPDELRGKGVDAVLSKPVKLEDILAAVAAFGARRAEGGTAA